MPTKADALREELAALRRRLAEAEARRVPEAVPLKPQIAAPVAGHSTAPFAPATRVQCATRVQSVVRGQQARQDPARALERISEGPAAAEARRRARERARGREARRNEDYDAEAARQPEPSAAEQKQQRERVTPLMGTALLVALLELFALLENRHWAAATLEDTCECWYSCSKTPETRYKYNSDKYESACSWGGSWDNLCSCYFDTEVAYDLHGWTVHGRWYEGPFGFRDPKPHEAKGGGCAPCRRTSEGECGTALAAAFDGLDCKHQVDALVGSALCLAVAAAVFAALGWPKRFFPDVMLRRRFLGSGLALVFGGVVAVSTAGAYTAESERRSAGPYVACGRGCWDAYGGGIVAVVGGLAIVATQVSPGFCGKSGYPDCLLGVGLFAVVAFLLITTVKALWNGWLGFLNSM